LRANPFRCPELEFKLLAIVINEAVYGDFGPAYLRSQKGNVVESLFGTDIEDIVALKRIKSLSLVGRQRERLSAPMRQSKWLVLTVRPCLFPRDRNA
jgi:hypothetical protein